MRIFLIAVGLVLLLGCSTMESTQPEIKITKQVVQEKQGGFDFPEACQACPEGDCIGYFTKDDFEFSCIYSCEDGKFYYDYCEDGRRLYDKWKKDKPQEWDM